MNIQKLVHGAHVLAFADSSSALVWMHKAYFDPVNNLVYDTVAQWLGWTLISNKVSLYSQHIKGDDKIIADLLSRDFRISYCSLTKKINSILPPQTAASFHIKLPPREIISWILLLSASSTRSS